MNGRQSGEHQDSTPQEKRSAVDVRRDPIKQFFRQCFQLMYNQDQTEDQGAELFNFLKEKRPTYLKYQEYRYLYPKTWEEEARSFGRTDIEIIIEKEMARGWLPAVEKKKAKKKKAKTSRHKH